MMTFFKRLACGWKGHHFYHWRNIYGDEIMISGMNRSLWRCVKCGKLKLRPELHSAAGQSRPHQSAMQAQGEKK